VLTGACAPDFARVSTCECCTQMRPRVLQEQERWDEHVHCTCKSPSMYANVDRA
jgi:hypothetical protein